MSYEPVSTANRSELTSIIRDIRNRWRLKLAVRGAAFVVAGFLLTLLVSAYSLETLKFSPGSIIAFRVAMVMILGALAGYFFVLPQWRRVTDEQVALYLEECEPTLETAILSALEAEKGSSSHSPELARRLIEQAIERCGVHRARPPAGGPATAALCGRHRRHHRGGASSFRAGPGVSASGRLGTAAHGRRRPRSQPVPHQREARQHDGSARLRSGDRRHDPGLRIGQGRAAHPQIDQGAVRAHPDGLQQRHEDVRRHAVRPAGFDRLFRRVGRRKVRCVYDARGRSAVREAARDGIRVPVLHGSRAAEDRERRRYRRAAGDARARAHHADDEVAVGPHPDRRRHGDSALGRRRRVLRRRFPSQRTASIASSCRAAPKTSSSTPRPSTRSTCSKTRRRPCRLRSPAGIRRHRPSKSSRSKRAPTTTSACGSSSWCTP